MLEYGLFAAAFGWTPDVVSRLTVPQLEAYSGVVRSQSFLPLGSPSVQEQRAPSEPHGKMETEDYTADMKEALLRLRKKRGGESFPFPVVFAEMRRYQKEQQQ